MSYYFSVSTFAAKRIHSAGSNVWFEEVSDLERFERIKEKEVRELRVGACGGFLNEKRGKRDRVVVGLDLVKILFPILPLCLSHSLSSSIVPRKTDLFTLKKRK